GRLPDGPRHPRVAVAERGHRDAGPEIEILAPVGIPHPHAVAPHETDRRAGPVVRRVVLRRPFEQRLGIHSMCRPGRPSVHSTISVPTPSRVNSSRWIACGTRPSMMWALAVPA